ncbi:hypothetical protein OG819_53965 [Streptomyces sp. NBC_01549]|uniref:hypothetical protein n=1 Tax=Streptomyces sp. NBC_01549 TaxID=2975874 RepID=UPI00224E6161|nr:hypothetical protein [Streptomyces sp. NBC_01549]MCX4598097.1 hypothetical protein [Streptomyces sp. NBC_01549]
MFELESQGDLGAGLVADQHGHRLAELVRCDVVVRDLRQSGVLAVCVDVPDVVVDELLARAEAIGGFGQAGVGEDEFGMEREFFGDHDRAGDRFRDPPVLQRPAGILLALAGDDCGGAEELVDQAAAADLPDLAVAHHRQRGHEDVAGGPQGPAFVLQCSAVEPGVPGSGRVVRAGHLHRIVDEVERARLVVVHECVAGSDDVGREGVDVGPGGFSE